MKEIEKALRGEAYNGSKAELVEERNRVRDIFMAYNQLNPGRQTAQAEALIRQLFGRIGKNFVIMPPLFVDYGSNIEIGDNFFSNYNLTILDCAKITIGNNVLIAPNVGLYAAGHPLSASLRAAEQEYAKPITIGDHVWIGGSVSVMPGVTIGSCTVIGGGSVVVRDIPSGVLAAGNPCRIIRELTAEERKMPVTDSQIS